MWCFFSGIADGFDRHPLPLQASCFSVLVLPHSRAIYDVHVLIKCVDSV